MKNRNPSLFRFTMPSGGWFLLILAIFVRCAFGAQNATWNGGPDFQGNYSNALNWSPSTVPNNSGSTTFDVTVPAPPAGNEFHGPTVDQNATVNNLTLINRSVLQADTNRNFTVLGTTSLTTTPGHDQEYGIINVGAGSTYLLGTLSNYDSDAQALTGGYSVDSGGAGSATLQFHNADVVTNYAFIFLSGSNARILNQNNGADAFANIEVNNGTLQFANGHSFTTAGDFTNNGLLWVGGFGSNATIFTINGFLTNYDATTHTLNGGFYTLDGTGGSATLKFNGADVETLNADVQMSGNATITDENGNDAFRHLSSSSGTITLSGTRTLTPTGGTLTNNGGATNVTGGANLTVSGNYHQSGGTTQVGNNSGNTAVHVTGTVTLDGGALDFGDGYGSGFDSSLQADGGFDFGGNVVLDGTGFLIGDTQVNAGHVIPGHSAGKITVVGNLNLGSQATMTIQIGGTSPGDQFDQIEQNTGLLTLGGTLELGVIDGAENVITNSDTFDIITSSQTITGSFNNIASGNRLYTTDGIGSFLVSYAGQDTVRLSNFALVLKLSAAASRKTHSGIDHDIPLALTGQPTVECRSSGGNHKLVFVFANNVVSGNAALMTQLGGAISGTPTFSGNTMTVNVTGVTDKQTIVVTLTNVTDVFAQVLPSATVSMSVLTGDTTGDGVVNSADVSQTKSRSGQPVTDANCRSDVTVGGGINSADVSMVKSKSGNALPPASAALRPQRRRH